MEKIIYNNPDKAYDTVEDTSSKKVWKGDFTINNDDDAIIISTYTSISGNLIIEDSPLEDIHGLNNLTSVGGSLFIGYNKNLTNIEGLSNVLWVGGYFSIIHNNALKNIDGLSNLLSVNRDLRIENNSELKNIDGLSNLNFVQGNLSICYNDSLLIFEKVNKLTMVDGINHSSLSDSILNEFKDIEFINQLKNNGFTGTVIIEGNGHGYKLNSA